MLQCHQLDLFEFIATKNLRRSFFFGQFCHFLMNMSSVLFHTVFMAPWGTAHTTRVHVRTGARFSSAALLGLMVMCFTSTFCCGCVSQAGRLTNCSVLLNVIVMEAVNGSELIAVTHLATCYCVLQFKTPCPGELVLSRCF